MLKTRPKTKKLIAVALAAMSIGSQIVPALAAPLSPIAFANATTNTAGNANVGTGKASITLFPTDVIGLSGKTFNVYKLFDAENSAGGESINYTLNPVYAGVLKQIVGDALHIGPTTVTEYQIIDYIQTMNTNKVEGVTANQKVEGSYSQYRNFVEEIRNAAVNGSIKPTHVIKVAATANDGSFSITGLDYGYYIVDEVTTGWTERDDAASLCIVNTANPTATAQIKASKPFNIKKINEDDNKTTVGNDGWNDIADYEIGQTVPYRYTSNIPNMNGYDTYFFRWHDVMDEALTFDPSSVKITISDYPGATSTKADYTLKPTEFSVKQNVGTDTFQITVNDIKKVVDEHFNRMNSKNENIYGQQVTVTYNATLNDKAATRTGRPGFENDVRLEFSNNPDRDGKGETGFTPWDTVVCFTYKIEGLKTNNHDLPLEEAKFRLYSDKDCNNEVYVKQSKYGYIVINRDSLGGNDHAGGTKPAESVEMVSDDKGTFTITGLDQGIYWLKETDSPPGYRELLDPIRIEITPSFTTERNDYIKGDGATASTLKKLTAKAEVKSFWDLVMHNSTENLNTVVQDGEVDITVINRVGTKLPVTGSTATIALLGGSVAVLVASKKVKNKEDE